MDINLNDGYWDRVRGIVTELRVDSRWILRSNEEGNRPIGSLRIVSHPDLKPGYLRAFFTFVKNIREKTEVEKIRTIEDYQMELEELEVYSVDEEFKTDKQTYEAPFSELQELFGVQIFE